jgi:predicted DNA-binding protein
MEKNNASMNNASTKSVMLYIPEDMLARATMLASTLGCSRNYLLVQLIETGLDELEKEGEQ